MVRSGELLTTLITNGERVNDLALVLFCSEILQLVCFNFVSRSMRTCNMFVPFLTHVEERDLSCQFSDIL